MGESNRHHRRRTLRGFLIAGLTALPQVVYALHSQTPLDAYAVQRWGTADGLPQGSVVSLAQSRDGYLWVGTQDGLARFDGLRFSAIPSGSTSPLRNSRISALAVADDDTLWVGTSGGVAYRAPGRRLGDWLPLEPAGTTGLIALATQPEGTVWISGSRRGLQRWRHGEFTTVIPAIPTSKYPRTIVRTAPNGVLWVASTDTGLIKEADSGWTTVIAPAQLPDPRIVTFLVQQNGAIWVTTLNGDVLRIPPGDIAHPTLVDTLKGDMAVALVEDSDDNVWLGTEKHGLQRYAGSQLSGFRKGHLLSTAHVISLLEDNEHNLWCGTDDGLFRVRDSAVSFFDPAGIAGQQAVWSIDATNPATVWVGSTAEGVFQLGETPRHFGIPDGLGVNAVYAITRHPKTGELWAGTAGGGVRILRGDTFVPATSLDALGSAHVDALFSDTQGRLWIGALGPPEVYVSENGVVRPIPLDVSGAGVGVRAFGQDSEGVVWAATSNSGLFTFNDERFQRAHLGRPLSSESLLTLYVDSHGDMWVGTLGAGLNWLHEGSIHVFGTAQGLPSESVSSLLDDGQGRLWMCTGRGLASVARSQFDEVVHGIRDTVEALTYGAADGLGEADCQGATQPSALKSADGRLWFPTTKGAVVATPGEARHTPRPPPVHIENVLIDGAPQNDWKSLRVPAGRNRVEFEFAAAVMTSPTRVRYRHRLEGFDTRWVDVRDAHQAVYTNLPGGSYQFTVIAANHEGLWNTEGANLAFTVDTPFRQTWTFYVLLSATVLVLAFIVHRWRMLKLESHNAVLRERQRIARDVHDTLAQGLIGIKVQLEVAKAKIGNAPNGALEHIERARALADASVEETHNTVYALREVPSEDVDLRFAISQMVEGLTLHAPLSAQVHADQHLPSLDPDCATQLLRLVREAVTNTLRHAEARSLTVEVADCKRGVRVLIKDDGIGFDPSVLVTEGQYGLISMRERAERIGATLSIEGREGAGTRIEVFVPISAIQR